MNVSDTSLSQLTRITEVLSCVYCVFAQFFFDAKELVVLRQSLRTARSTRLNLASAQPNYQIGDEAVLSFSRAVRYHDSPSVVHGHLCSAN